jgi:hypothetical protein
VQIGRPVRELDVEPVEQEEWVPDEIGAPEPAPAPAEVTG